MEKVVDYRGNLFSRSGWPYLEGSLEVIDLQGAEQDRQRVIHKQIKMFAGRKHLFIL